MTKRLLAVILLLGLPAAIPAAEPVKRFSPHSVTATMNRLERAVTGKGLTVFARIDHQANARDAGMEMAESQVLIFGNPKMGTLIMRDNPAAGLDLPLRVVVYQGGDGRTWIGYHDPREMEETFGIRGNKALDKAAGALGRLTEAATR